VFSSCIEGWHFHEWGPLNRLIMNDDSGITLNVSQIPGSRSLRYERVVKAGGLIR
jgi:hypothetical protein